MLEAVGIGVLPERPSVTSHLVSLPQSPSSICFRLAARLSLVIPSPADACCHIEFAHRPVIRLMQFLDGLVGRFMPAPAEVRQLIPGPANLMIFLLCRHFHFQAVHPQARVLRGKAGRTMAAVQFLHACFVVSPYPAINPLVCEPEASCGQLTVFVMGDAILHRRFTFFIKYRGQREFVERQEAASKTE